MQYTDSKLIQYELGCFTLFEKVYSGKLNEENNNIFFIINEGKLNVSVFLDNECVFAVDLEQKDVTQLKNQLTSMNNILTSKFNEI